MKKHYILFFLDDFHHGAINHVTHFIGFFLLGYGVGKLNIVLVLISPIIMESGHLYNYLKGIHREHAIKIIPLQVIAWVIFVGIGYIVSLFIG